MDHLTFNARVVSARVLVIDLHRGTQDTFTSGTAVTGGAISGIDIAGGTIGELGVDDKPIHTRVLSAVIVVIDGDGDPETSPLLILIHSADVAKGAWIVIVARLALKQGLWRARLGGRITAEGPTLRSGAEHGAILVAGARRWRLALASFTRPPHLTGPTDATTAIITAGLISAVRHADRHIGLLGVIGV